MGQKERRRRRERETEMERQSEREIMKGGERYKPKLREQVVDKERKKYMDK